MLKEFISVDVIGQMCKGGKAFLRKLWIQISVPVLVVI